MYLGGISLTLRSVEKVADGTKMYWEVMGGERERERERVGVLRHFNR